MLIKSGVCIKSGVFIKSGVACQLSSMSPADLLKAKQLGYSDWQIVGIFPLNQALLNRPGVGFVLLYLI